MAVASSNFSKKISSGVREADERATLCVSDMLEAKIATEVVNSMRALE